MPSQLILECVIPEHIPNCVTSAVCHLVVLMSMSVERDKSPSHAHSWALYSHPGNTEWMRQESLMRQMPSSKETESYRYTVGKAGSRVKAQKNKQHGGHQQWPSCSLAITDPAYLSPLLFSTLPLALHLSTPSPVTLPPGHSTPTLLFPSAAAVSGTSHLRLSQASWVPVFCLTVLIPQSPVSCVQSFLHVTNLVNIIFLYCSSHEKLLTNVYPNLLLQCLAHTW